LAPRFPEAYARNISLQQILTGTTGLAYDFMTQFRQLGSAADPLAYVMGLPRDSQPAGTWSYNDAAISLLTPILESAQGLSLPELAQRDLFTPLGITRFTWDRDKTGKHLAYAGLRLRTQDLAKIAGLVSHRGQWQAQQVLPAAWADDCTRSHGPTAWRVPPVTESGFGYLWFTGRLQGLPVAWAWGYGAQFALVAPTAGLAIATAATEPPPARLAAQNAAVMDLVSQVLALAAKPAASGDTRKI
jgi:CubicO group peptidase (beta-lactamase class C family)